MSPNRIDTVPITHTATTASGRRSSRLRKRRNTRLILLGLAIVLTILTLFTQDTGRDQPARVAVSLPDSQRVIIINPLNGKILTDLHLKYDAECVAYSMNGKTLFVSDRQSNRIHLLDTATMKEKSHFTTKLHTIGIMATTDANILQMSHEHADQTRYNLKKCLKHPDTPNPGELSPAQRLPVAKIHANFGANQDTNSSYETNILVDHSLQEVIVANGATGQPLTTIPVGREPESLTWHPDRSRCFVLVSGDSRMAVIDPIARKVTKQVPCDPHPSRLMRPGNLTIAVIKSTMGKSVLVFDMDRERFRYRFTFPTIPADINTWPDPSSGGNQNASNDDNDGGDQGDRHGDNGGDQGDRDGDNGGDQGDHHNDNGGNQGDRNSDNGGDQGDRHADNGGNQGDRTGDNGGDQGDRHADNGGNQGDRTGDNGGNQGDRNSNNGGNHNANGGDHRDNSANHNGSNHNEPSGNAH